MRDCTMKGFMGVAPEDLIHTSCAAGMCGRKRVETSPSGTIACHHVDTKKIHDEICRFTLLTVHSANTTW